MSLVNVCPFFTHLRCVSRPLKELNQLTGVAAILTFPLDVEVVEAEERDAAEELRQETGA